MPPAFSTHTMVATCGLLFIAQAVLVWQVLHGRGERRPVVLWALGSLAGGVGLLLLGLRGVLPGWATLQLAILLLPAAQLWRAQSLRVQLRVPEHGLGHLAALALFSLGDLALAHVGLEQARVLWAVAATTLSLAYLARQAWRVAERLRVRAAWYLAWTALASTGFGVLWLALMLAGVTPVQMLPQHWAMLLLAAMLGLAVLWSNLSHVGLVLDQMQLAERASRDQALVQSARADEAELQALRLQAVMAEREALANDRDRLLRVMTHEVRQPLHQASGVLQALRQAPLDTAPLAVARWVSRVDQADEVLGEVRDVLDNVLQAATLLQRREPLALQHTELPFLIDFCLLDLPPTQRDRVQVQWRAQVGPVPMAATLVRLALRNLLRNAFTHGGPAVQVQLRIEERFTPHCLVIAVVDNGKGLIESALIAERALSAVAAPQPPIPPIAPVAPGDVRQGLGFQIVRQVMALHGGRLSLHNLRGAGLSAAMELPMQGASSAALPCGPATA